MGVYGWWKGEEERRMEEKEKKGEKQDGSKRVSMQGVRKFDKD